MEILQRRFYASLFLKGSEIADIGSLCDSFEFSAMRQSTFSEFLLDVAWLLKEPASESFQQSVTASQIQRFNSLLNFLICYDSTTILDKLLEKLKIVISDMKFNSTVNGSDADLSLLQKHIGNARHILHKKYKKSESSVLQSGSASRGNSVSESCSQDNVLSDPINSKVRTKFFLYFSFCWLWIWFASSRLRSLSNLIHLFFFCSYIYFLMQEHPLSFHGFLSLNIWVFNFSNHAPCDSWLF